MIADCLGQVHAADPVALKTLYSSLHLVAQLFFALNYQVRPPHVNYTTMTLSIAQLDHVLFFFSFSHPSVSLLFAVVVAVVAAAAAVVAVAAAATAAATVAVAADVVAAVVVMVVVVVGPA